MNNKRKMKKEKKILHLNKGKKIKNKNVILARK
jgi:hypothetical protein